MAAAVTNAMWKLASSSFSKSAVTIGAPEEAAVEYQSHTDILIDKGMGGCRIYIGPRKLICAQLLHQQEKEETIYNVAITHTRRGELNGDRSELGNELVQQVL